MPPFAREHQADLLAVPNGKLVVCRVVRDFYFGPDQLATVGQTIRLPALKAGEYHQNGWVEIQLAGARVITVDDPDYSPPVVATVRLRWLRSGFQFRDLSGNIAVTVAGAEADVLAFDHGQYLCQPNAIAELAA